MDLPRFQFSLRFILFWLMPYAAVAAAILSTDDFGGNEPRAVALVTYFWGLALLLVTVSRARAAKSDATDQKKSS